MSRDSLSAGADAQAHVRPAHVCRALLAALEAAEGRRKSRKRDQTPDTIGLNAKRALLERAVRDDPEPDAFEQWLLCYVQAQSGLQPCGTTTAMARAVLEEWRLAHSSREFAQWLRQGAPSEDAEIPARSAKSAGR